MSDRRDIGGKSTADEGIEPMGEKTAISWCDATFNCWVGCSRVSPACLHCYAARDNARYGWVRDADGKPAWDGPRKRTSEANWRKPLQWNRKAAATGKPLKVFCASLADVFDNEVPDEWRRDLFELIQATPNLRWILLTKRIGNVAKMMGADWPRNAGLMATLENQEVWDRDYPKLVTWRNTAPWIGVSAEPLLGRIDIGPLIRSLGSPHWIITGGESGPRHRPLDMDAVRVIRDTCDVYGITFHHKQNGGTRGKDAGCLVDGVEHKHFPAALAA